MHNSYSALWTEYSTLTSTIPLMNVIRRILEYYFLQLCGYEEYDLTKKVLEEKKDTNIILPFKSRVNRTTPTKIPIS